MFVDIVLDQYVMRRKLSNILIEPGWDFTRRWSFCWKIVLVVAYCYIMTFVIIGDGVWFRDRMNYIEALERIKSGKYEDVSFIAATRESFSAEAGWRNYIMPVVAHVIDDPTQGLNVLSFISLLTMTIFCVRNISPLIVFYFMANPLVLSFVFSQQRNSFACSVLLLALMLKKIRFFAVGTVLALTVHMGSLLISLAYILVHCLLKIKLYRLGFRIFLVSIAISGVMLSFTIGKMGKVILLKVNDHRAFVDYGSMSLLNASFWFVMLGILVCYAMPRISKKGFRRLGSETMDPVGNERRHSLTSGNRNSAEYHEAVLRKDMYARVLDLYVPVVLLGASVGFVLNGFYANRFIVMAFPFFLNAVAYLPPRIETRTFSLFAAYQVVQYYYWTRA